MHGTLKKEKYRKIVVIGLDGATFDIIDPLIKKGKLPNLSKIMENGVRGELKSTIHPITPQAWTTFLTGKNAGKHGIFDFTSRKSNSYDIKFINASTRKAQSIFSILSKADKKVGAVAIPFTFPPEKINGFMLSGIDAPVGNEMAVHPDKIYTEIKRNFGRYYIHLASPVGRKIDKDKFWKDIKTEDENRTLISQYLMENYPCDLFMTVYNNIDRVQHQHLDENVLHMIRNNSDVSDEDLLVKTYINTDSHLGSLLSKIDSDTSVIIMSDHGAGPIRKFFFLNRWLQENGFLTYRKEDRHQFQRAVHLARFMAKRFCPRWIKNLMKSCMGEIRDKVESMLSFAEIDWENTKAYAFGMYGNIYINLKGREPKGIVEPGREYESVCNQIIKNLSKLEDPDRDGKIIEKVYQGKKLYDGPYVGNAPDLIIKWKDYSYYTSYSSTPSGKGRVPLFGSHMNIDCSAYKHVGTHRLNGIFMVKGDIIKGGIRICGAHISDMAPTILYLLGQSIPDDMDGRLLIEIFKKDFLRDNPPKYYKTKDNGSDSEKVVTYSKEEIRDIEERLKGLGYL